MENVTRLKDTTDPTRAFRAAFVLTSLKSERWSVRQAALATGISHSVLASRANGTTPFLADELEAIATLLKRDPVEFYGEYLKAGNGDFHGGTSQVTICSLAPVTELSQFRGARAAG